MRFEGWPVRVLAGVLLAASVLSIGTPPAPTARAAAPPLKSDWLGFAFVNGVTPAGQPYQVSETRYSQATESGGRWTRWPMYWNQIESVKDVFDYAAQDSVVNADRKHGLQINAILLGTPGWASPAVATIEGPTVPFDVGRKPVYGGSGVGGQGSGVRGEGSGDGGEGSGDGGVGSGDGGRGSGNGLHRMDPTAGSSQPSTFNLQPSTANQRPSVALPASGSPAGVPSGLDLPVFVGDSVNRENRWAWFVFQTVSRYRDRVSVWEIWNEPDLMFGSTPVFWAGSPEQFARLVKVAYLATKKADPNATVMMGGMMYWSRPDFFPRVLDTLRSDSEGAANRYFFDAVAWHPYISPNNLVDFVERARGQLSARGMNKPIWINETNIPVCDDKSVDPVLSCPALYRGTMDEQASYIVQTAALGAALGIDRQLYFQLYDDSVGPSEWYGLVRNSGSPRPSLSAFATVSRFLSRYSTATWRRDTGYDLVQLGGVPDGAGTVRVTVLWTRTSAGLTVSVGAAGQRGDGRLVDKFGVSAAGRLTKDGSVYRIALPGLTNSDLAAGSPYFLIEPVDPDSAAPLTSLVPLAGESCRGVRPVWTATDNGWGAWNYDVDVQEGPSTAWSRWLSATVRTSAPFDGTVGQRYRFRARARDLAGNEGGWSAVTETRLSSCGAVGETVQNGGFEQGLTGWNLAGSTAPRSASEALLGNGAAVLGLDPRPEIGSNTGNSTLRQTVEVPATRPTLTLSYKITSDPGCRRGWFEVLLGVGQNPTTRIDYPVAPGVLWKAVDWTRHSADLSAYAGQRIDLLFNAVNRADSSPTTVYLDNVSLATGSAPTIAGSSTLTNTRVFFPALFNASAPGCTTP